MDAVAFGVEVCYLVSHFLLHNLTLTPLMRQPTPLSQPLIPIRTQFLLTHLITQRAYRLKRRQNILRVVEISFICQVLPASGHFKLTTGLDRTIAAQFDVTGSAAQARLKVRFLFFGLGCNWKRYELVLILFFKGTASLLQQNVAYFVAQSGEFCMH